MLQDQHTCLNVYNKSRSAVMQLMQLYFYNYFIFVSLYFVHVLYSVILCMKYMNDRLSEL